VKHQYKLQQTDHDEIRRGLNGPRWFNKKEARNELADLLPKTKSLENSKGAYDNRHLSWESTKKPARCNPKTTEGGI